MGHPFKVWVLSAQDAETRYDEAAAIGGTDGWTWWEATMQHVNPVALYRFVIEVAGTDQDGPAYWHLNNAGLHNRDTSNYMRLQGAHSQGCALVVTGCGHEPGLPGQVFMVGEGCRAANP
ncbi:hypothetical protein AAGW05_16765 [Arthrobacter sp. LAPM80]|uniref:hypothetical protein n=1 Tax=Arthrobacter sp. LAPM80 TaxID=3141788 RepID=UPI00398BB313